MANNTLIDETMKAAKLMAGASWPSADTTRWALERLEEELGRKLEQVQLIRKGQGAIILALRNALQGWPEIARMYKCGPGSGHYKCPNCIAKEALAFTQTQAEKTVKAIGKAEAALRRLAPSDCDQSVDCANGYCMYCVAQPILKEIDAARKGE